MESKKKYNLTKIIMYLSILIVITVVILLLFYISSKVNMSKIIIIILLAIFVLAQISAGVCYINLPKLELKRITEYMSNDSIFEHKISGEVTSEDIISKLQQKEYKVYNEGDFILGQKFIKEDNYNIYAAISFIHYANNEKVGYDINIHNQMINDFISKNKVEVIKGNINVSCAISKETPEDIKSMCSTPEISRRMNMISAYIPILFDETKSMLYYCDGIKKAEDCKIYKNVIYADRIVKEIFEL